MKKKRKKDDPDVEAPELLTRKVQLAPSVAQKALLKRWFGGARWVYNHAVATFKETEMKPTKKDLRKRFAHDEAFSKENTWMLQVPYDVRDGALEDALTAQSNARKLNKEKGIKSNLRFRSKKAQSQSIYIPKASVKRITDHEVQIYGPKYRLGPIRTRECLPQHFDHAFRLQFTRLGEVALIVPMDSPPKPPPPAQDAPKRILSLDPGVRTFMTGYDPSGHVIEVGGGDMARIARLCFHIDALQSRIAKAPCTSQREKGRKWRMQKAAARMRLKIRNLVGDVHYKLANFLATSYDLVLLPLFETSKMVKRARRRIRSKTARAMLTWAHYTFRQRLLNRCKRSNCSVALVTEEYTSKTCGKCGCIHQKLGGRKRFKCPQCKHEADRDHQAARNILLKNAEEVELSFERCHL